MPGPRPGGPLMHPQPIIHRPHPVACAPRYHSYLGTGLSALIGSALGVTIANKVSNKKAEKKANEASASNANNNTYEVFSYCPNCGTQRAGNTTVCSNCGASLIK